MKPEVFILGILWCATLSATSVHSAPPLEDYSLTIVPDEYKGKLIFLGAYVHLEVHGNGLHTGPEARSGTEAAPVLTSSTYSLSPEMNTLAEARESCPRYTQGKGMLLKIETPEEDQKIQDFLIARASHIQHPEFFWTDGVSNRTGHWKWNSNGASMEYHHFHIKPGAGGLMAFRSISEDREDFEWVALYDRKERHYFICEVEPENVPMPCSKENDLVIVLDSSKSVEDVPYEQAREFAAKLAGAFASPSRVSFITYSEAVTKRFGLSQSISGRRAQEEIMKHERNEHGVTNTGRGIEMAIAELEDNKRAGVAKKIVVLTDGESYSGSDHDAKKETIDASQKATAKNIQTFSVGIGDFEKKPAFKEELLTIAARIKENRFTINNFDDLINRIREISITVCKT